MFMTWDQTSSTEETNSLIRELACWHLQQVHCESNPQSYVARTKRTIHNAIWYEDWAMLANCELAYIELSPVDAYHLRAVLALYSKRQDLDLGVDKEKVAYDKFIETEAACSETNQVFKAWTGGTYKFLPGVDAIIHRAQRKISSVLGDVPSLDSLRLRFGPGATTQTKRRNASARRKLSEPYSCSEDLCGTVNLVLEEMPAWIPFGESEKVTVDVLIQNGHLHFVPKNAKTHRSVVVEPILNSMLQLGIGEYMASRLKRFGVDISDQTRNQNLAQIGSIDGGLATLDLSSASDTIAYELVAHLLPIDWFLFLCRARTGTVEYKDHSFKLQKFSSMGNGFTFPLETLIFWALSSACVDESELSNVSVYGDDIIVPTHAVPRVRQILATCGFTVNDSKSFDTGPFRESCGKDYLSGFDIRPVYIKDRLSCSDLFVLHNFHVRRNEHEAARILLRHIDPSIAIFGPDLYGDGHLIGDYMRVPHKNASPLTGGWCGYTFETYSFRGKRDFRAHPGDYIFPSYCTYVREKSTSLTDLSILDLIVKNRGLFRRPGLSGYVGSVAKSLNSLRSASDVCFRSDGAFGVSLPGAQGYKRIKIYTLG